MTMIFIVYIETKEGVNIYYENTIYAPTLFELATLKTIKYFR